MKIRTTIISTVAFMALCSCQKELENSEQIVSNEDLPKVIAYAPGYKPESKTVIQNETEVWWGPKDSINVFFGVDCNLGKFTSLSNSVQKATVFMGEKAFAMGSIAESSPLKFWSAYPYNAANTCDNTAITLTVPETQTAVAGSFDPKAFPSIARSNDMTFAFYNVCGGIRFSVTKPGVIKVIFKGNDNEDLAGKVKVRMDGDGKPASEVVEGESEVMLICEDGLTVGSWYYIALLPGTLTSGYTLRFETAGQFAEKKSLSSVSVNRSRFGTLEKADAGLIYQNIQFVDLGLSVKWAARNLGSDIPEGYGLYYQWGDTVGYGSNTSDGKVFNWSSYKWCNGTETTLTKYNASDRKTVLEPEDDAAYAALGEVWRIPTKEEWEELVNTDNCSWTWTSLNGVNGYKIQSKKPGYETNWIFLPAAGMRLESTLSVLNKNCLYWSSSLYTDPRVAYRMDFSSEHILIEYKLRSYGYSIRPVSDDSDGL